MRTLGAHVACPRCEAVFLPQGASCNPAHGEARCDACGMIFKILGAAQAAADGDAPGAREDTHARFPDRVSDQRPAGWGEPPEPAESTAVHPLETSANPPATAPASPRTHSPPTARSDQININGVDSYLSPGSGLLHGFWWAAVALVLALLLGWQVRNPFLEKYAQHADYRAFLSVSCVLFNCDLPPKKDLLRLTLTHTAIDFHPLAPGALRATIKLVNEATFAQPWPDLQMIFTDRNGRVVGRRTFAPDRYLEDGRPDRIDSGELGVVRLDFARPHKNAAGFEVGIVTGPVSQ